MQNTEIIVTTFILHYSSSPPSSPFSPFGNPLSAFYSFTPLLAGWLAAKKERNDANYICVICPPPPPLLYVN